MDCLQNLYNDVIKNEVRMHSSPFLTVNQNCDQVRQWAEHQILKAGLRSVQTFDLHTARTASHSCECPHHGTDQCDCQMVVLLVYGSTSEPATLILHGNDGQTWLSVTVPERTSRALADQIQQALAIEETTSSGLPGSSV